MALPLRKEETTDSYKRTVQMIRNEKDLCVRKWQRLDTELTDLLECQARLPTELVAMQIDRMRLQLTQTVLDMGHLLADMWQLTEIKLRGRL